MIESIKHLPAFDIFVIVFLLYCIFRGGKRGIFMQITSIIALFVSWYLASRYSSVLEPYVPLNEILRKKVAAIGTFIIANIALNLLFRIISGGVTQGLLKEVNRQMGALFGLAKGILVCFILTYFAVITSAATKKLVLGSQSGRIMASAICALPDKLPSNSHTVKIKTALEEFQKEVGNQPIQEKTSSDYQISAFKNDIASSLQKVKEKGSTLKSTIDNLNTLSSSISDFQNKIQETVNGNRPAPSVESGQTVSAAKTEIPSDNDDPINKTGSLLDSIFSQKSFKAVSPVDNGDRSAERNSFSEIYGPETDNQTYYNPYY